SVGLIVPQLEERRKKPCRIKSLFPSQPSLSPFRASLPTPQRVAEVREAVASAATKPLLFPPEIFRVPRALPEVAAEAGRAPNNAPASTNTACGYYPYPPCKKVPAR